MEVVCSPLRHRAVRKLSRLLYRTVGIQGELSPFPYPEVFHETQSIHIHVPKSAGNSARQIVYGATSRSLGGHVPASVFFEASPALFRRYFVFATVRHPLHRLHSAYRYLQHGGMSRKDRAWGASNLMRYSSFRQFVEALNRGSVRDEVLRYIHFWPQTNFVCDPSGRLLVDYMVRAENFEAEMHHVCERLSKPYISVHENASRDDGGRELLDPDLDAICRAVYPRDYAVLGY